ncbi:MAG TPA: hypothetical protein VNY05_04325 [Candidatus Acidoferrales bacterium]|nr:hypothetical protein [Candidatus Acidoferrales bacterium]
MNWRIVLLLAILTQPFPVDAANDAPLERATLKGLTAVGVVIDTLDQELAHENLTQDALQSRMERRLQNAGIPLVKDGREFLGLRVTQVRSKRGPVAVSISIGLYQPVLLSRDRNIRTVTQTWEVVTTLMAEPKVLYEASMTSVDELIDRFVAAYQSMNPK